MNARTYARAETRCDGLKARVDREVTLAAISDEDDRAARNARLAFWHARQLAAHDVFYRNGLCFAPSSGNRPPVFSGAGRYSCPSEAWLNAEP